ncbi:hypothetical protein [Lysobacter solisilvae (ex Woo and Kim 2020)]|uniref:Lipoprotein n=1 Tax=Agrilutibacter terrestris TaxID=2865112 RepID=A0A7H0FVY1_9GAMM|nr:hypothetical protein [Lysobacter terrestris]QNP40197.1 hypothetical protein H8B22_11970 [Lysobacter terrestris]
MSKFIAPLAMSLVAAGCVTTEPNRVGGSRVGEEFTTQQEVVTYECADPFDKNKKAICLKLLTDITHGDKVLDRIDSGTKIHVSRFKKWSGWNVSFNVAYVQISGSYRELMVANLDRLRGSSNGR